MASYGGATHCISLFYGLCDEMKTENGLKVKPCKTLRLESE